MATDKVRLQWTEVAFPDALNAVSDCDHVLQLARDRKLPQGRQRVHRAGPASLRKAGAIESKSKQFLDQSKLLTVLLLRCIRCQRPNDALNGASRRRQVLIALRST